MSAFLETRAYETGFPIDVFRVKDNRFLAHWHLDVEIAYVVRGGIRIGCNRESRLMCSGEIAVSGSSDIHWYQSEDPSSLIVVVIFRPEMAGSPAGRWVLLFVHHFSRHKLLPQSLPSIENSSTPCFQVLSARWTRAPRVHHLRVEGMAKELCALLQRHLALVPRPALLTNIRFPDLEHIQAAITYIQAQSAQPLTLSAIARRFALSEAYFSRLFSAFAGLSFHEYVARVRVNAAEQLLRSTRRTVLDVALECGFRSVPHVQSDLPQPIPVTRLVARAR